MKRVAPKPESTMVTYTNDAGSTMSFEKGIPEKQILERMSWMGGKWRKVE